MNQPASCPSGAALGARWRIEPGLPHPMGPRTGSEGVNFAVFSAHARQIDICLFDEDGQTEIARLPLPRRDGDIWHGFVPGLKPGALYGLRAHGPYDPAHGDRFNPHKLLIDPYARALRGELIWHDAVYGYTVGHAEGDLSFDARDSAPFVPKCVVPEPEPEDRPPRPLRPARESTIYEAHVKGLTARHPDVPAVLRGRFAGVSSAPMLRHLTRLGVTAIELMPAHAFVDDRFLVKQGLRNYWGYQSIAFFAPAPRYCAGADPQAEFRDMAAGLRAAGLELILDVVYNHSGEGDELGPTLSFRGLDNRSYYHLAGRGRHYVNHTGTGNALNLAHPMVLRMVLDSMRYWVGQMGVDGFRFDLAPELLRGAEGFHPGSAFLAALQQDPVLSQVRLIAEPWDIGPGGYRLGGFPHPFHEWNDRYRDDVRRFWRGDGGAVPGLARRLLGSAELFDHSHRDATASVNLITAHDGFTLRDVVSYSAKHNLPNGEQNRDGHSENFSDNLGVEGPTTDPAIRAARDRRARNLMATLMLSQGLPMVLAGDELGNSQQGNNNAYPQDNATGWVDWSGEDPAMTDFLARLIALRRGNPVLSQRGFLHSQIRAADGLRDVEWRCADGRAPRDGDWNNPDLRLIGVVMRGSAESGEDPTAREVFAVFNAGGAATVTLPPGAWLRALDSSRPTDPATPAQGDVPMSADSVLVFTRPD